MCVCVCVCVREREREKKSVWVCESTWKCSAVLWKLKGLRSTPKRAAGGGGVGGGAVLNMDAGKNGCSCCSHVRIRQ